MPVPSVLAPRVFVDTLVEELGAAAARRPVHLGSRFTETTAPVLALMMPTLSRRTSIRRRNGEIWRRSGTHRREMEAGNGGVQGFGAPHTSGEATSRVS